MYTWEQNLEMKVFLPQCRHLPRGLTVPFEFACYVVIHTYPYSNSLKLAWGIFSEWKMLMSKGKLNMDKIPLFLTKHSTKQYSLAAFIFLLLAEKELVNMRFTAKCIMVNLCGIPK